MGTCLEMSQALNRASSREKSCLQQWFGSVHGFRHTLEVMGGILHRKGRPLCLGSLAEVFFFFHMKRDSYLALQKENLQWLRRGQTEERRTSSWRLPTSNPRIQITYPFWSLLACAESGLKTVQTVCHRLGERGMCSREMPWSWVPSGGQMEVFALSKAHL